MLKGKISWCDQWSVTKGISLTLLFRSRNRLLKRWDAVVRQRRVGYEEAWREASRRANWIRILWLRLWLRERDLYYSRKLSHSSNLPENGDSWILGRCLNNSDELSECIELLRDWFGFTLGSNSSRHSAVVHRCLVDISVNVQLIVLKIVGLFPLSWRISLKNGSIILKALIPYILEWDHPWANLCGNYSVLSSWNYPTHD